MANISISDLRPTGYDLFFDYESYMKDLSDEELNIQGGITPALYVAAEYAIASSEACGLLVVIAIDKIFN
ncbi:MAG: hypothetical protein V7K41_07605 [Nostoc sp.]|uniref:hypothetical protein n=1 Tax=Nostoc sp. TaxID=1180 RepID=UPI002FF7E6BC